MSKKGIKKGFFAPQEQHNVSEQETQRLEQELGAKRTHLEGTPMTLEKPRKNPQLTQAREISAFSLERRLDTEKLTMMINDLREEVLSLKEQNRSLLEKIEYYQQRTEDRLMTQERELQAMWYGQTGMERLVKQIEEQNNQIKK